MAWRFISADKKLFSYFRVSTRRKRNSLVDKPGKLPVGNATQVTVKKKDNKKSIEFRLDDVLKNLYVFKSSVYHIDRI